jgi:hypothetical protein
MSKFFSGANITAQKITFSGSFDSNIALDELKIKKFLDKKLVRNNP